MADDKDTPTPLLEERPEPSLEDSDPKNVSRYVVVDRLGKGGMGKVYLAIDPVINRNVAVKVLPWPDFTDAHILRFQQEARASGKLSHPNIVKALDFGLTEKREPFLVMDYVEGETLDSFLETNGVLDLLDFHTVASQIVEAMIHAHGLGVVHRDLKPSNIIIKLSEGEQWDVFVLDFGLARIIHDSGRIVDTKTGQIVGSPRCMSPEQAMGRAIDERSDVYALGCVMFEALTGAPPFQGATAVDTVKMHLEQEPPRLSERVEGYPEQLEELIAKALRKKPDERFQSMSDLLSSLQAIPLQESEDSPTTEELGDENTHGVTQPAVESSGTIRLGVITAAILIVVLAVPYLFLQKGTEQKTRKTNISVSDDNPFPYGDQILQKRFILTSRDRDGSPARFMIMGTAKTSDEDLKKLQEDPELYETLKAKRALTLRSTDVTGSGFEDIPDLPIEYLDLSRSNVRDKNLIYIAKLKSLGELYLSGTAVSDQGLLSLSESPLKTLDIAGCDRVTNSGLQHLKRLKNLSTLNIAWIKVDRDSIRSLEKLKRLRVLIIDKSQSNLLKQSGFDRRTGVKVEVK